MKFAEKIKALFRRNKLSEETFEDLADLLIEGDMGAALAFEIVDSLKAACKKEGISDPDAAKAKLKELLRPYIKTATFELDPGKLNIVLILGVNGVGKTTSCAKLAQWAGRQYPGNNVILAAGDTFRAAAIDQLKIHGERLGIRVVAQQHGSDPGAVLWDAIDAAAAAGAQLVIADTAGRMHTRSDLVKELAKLDRVVSQRADQANYRKLLVLDATTGQNAMRQAETFHEAVKVDGVIMTKYDSTSKGGMIIAVSRQFGLPTLFLGTGEKYENLQPFNIDAYLEDFVGE
ncbi:Signal recognition particle receptor FtsY [uncultured spirochete]|jgi:fused signal recognition particle receptor|uniref:Signal recognition particle receptor FtsY n=1 Tax=uncultured spirochete TaxID=156406 RepID=A0A3P3XF79_9SPIR|nr:signal recognition particle-docking protein FtsY [Rectinema subterraneum]SLM09898.1 Signal recognition particle receptor FtsY [uncultured spirochete]